MKVKRADRYIRARGVIILTMLLYVPVFTCKPENSRVNRFLPRNPGSTPDDTVPILRWDLLVQFP